MPRFGDTLVDVSEPDDDIQTEPDNYGDSELTAAQSQVQRRLRWPQQPQGGQRLPARERSRSVPPWAKGASRSEEGKFDADQLD